MDPVTIGTVATALISKALDRAEDKSADAGVSALGRLLGRVRDHFRDHGNDADRAALIGVEEVPDSPMRLRALATAIDSHAGTEVGLREELQTLVDEAGKAGVDVASISLVSWGNHNIQIAGVSGSTITVKAPPRPRV